MALFKKKGGSDNPKEIWEDFFKVVMKNDWKKALVLIESLKQLEPDNPQVHMKIGDILQRTGETEGAVPAYHEAADCLVHLEDYSKALAIYKIILRLNPNDENAIARSHELMGGLPEASAQPEGNMTYEEATGEDGEYYEEPADGEDTYQEEAAPEEEYQEDAVAEDTYQEEAVESAPAYEEPEPEPEPEPVAASQSEAKASVALHDAFKRHPMFKVLDDVDIDIMIKKATHAVYEDGQAVITEGEPGDSMFIIKKGQANVTSIMFDKTYELATLGGGNFFGEVGFLTGMPRTATVSAKGGLSIMEINKPLMQVLIESNPKVLQKLVELSHSRTQKKIKKMND